MSSAASDVYKRQTFYGGFGSFGGFGGGNGGANGGGGGGAGLGGGIFVRSGSLILNNTTFYGQYGYGWVRI